MCTVPPPPGGNPIAVDKYININHHHHHQSILFSFGDDTCQTSVNTYVREVGTDDDASIRIIIIKL
jgi:hypothetical protein